MACVEDEHLLQAIRNLVVQAVEEGWSQQEWLYRARFMLHALRDADGNPYNRSGERAGWSERERRRYEQDVRQLDSLARLKLLLRTQSRLASGYREFCTAFEPFWLEHFPGWRFVRQPGAKTKRSDHVAHENEVRLKTDMAFWLARNSPGQGGFGNPYPPFGFNSWCWVEPVSREECERLGLLEPGQKVVAPAQLSQWRLPQLLQQRAVASTSGLGDGAVARIRKKCRQQGFDVVHDAEHGLMRALLPGLPRSGWPVGLAVPDASPRQKEPRREDYKTEEEWRKAHEAWLKRWRGDVGVQASNPYGCNGAGHMPACPLAGLDSNGRNDYNSHDERSKQDGNDTGGSRGGREGWQEGKVLSRWGSPSDLEPGGRKGNGRGLGRRVYDAETCRSILSDCARKLGVPEEFAEHIRLIATAQLQAVEELRK